MNSQNPDSSNDGLLDYCHHCGKIETKSGEFQSDELDDVYCPKCFPAHAVTLELVNFSSKKWKDVLDGPWIDLANAMRLAIDRIDRQRDEIRRKYDIISQTIRDFIGRQYVRKVDLWMFMHGIEDAIGELKYGNVWAKKELDYIHSQLDEIIKNLQEMSGTGENNK